MEVIVEVSIEVVVVAKVVPVGVSTIIVVVRMSNRSITNVKNA